MKTEPNNVRPKMHMTSGKYTFSVDELITANAHANTELARRGFQVIYTVFGVFMVVIALLSLDGEDTAVTLCIGLIGAYLAGLRHPITRLVIRRQFAKRPDKNIEIRFEASDEGMTWSSSDSSSTFRWNLIAKARRYSDGFLIFPNQKIFHWIPNHSFASDTEILQLSETLRRNIHDYRERA